MSAFNLTEAVQYASLWDCAGYQGDVHQGTLTVGVACIPLTATDASEILCPTDQEITVPLESNCDSLVSEFAQWETEDHLCYISCFEQNSDTLPASKLAARGLPYDEIHSNAVTGAATTLHPTNFLVSFAALLFIMFVFFKRM